MRTRSGGAFVATAVATLFAALVAIALRVAWDPPARTYVDYVPIGAVLAVLVWDRLSPGSSAPRALLIDATAVGLAAMRAFIPPLPFVSGHTLLATYAALTALHWPLRVIALVTLAEVLYTKIFASPGWVSMTGALVVAATLAAVRRRIEPGTASDNTFSG